MTQHSWIRTLSATALTALVSAMLGTAAFAQWPGPPPGGGPPFGGPGGFGRPGRGPGGPRGGMRGPQPASVADTPLAALAAGLNLTADQKTKIAAIQTHFTQQRRALMPPPDEGPPPDRETMRAGMDKMRRLDQQAVADIHAVLTGPQKQALTGLLKTLDALRFVGIPAETYGGLKLTVEQKTRITALAQTAQQATRAAMDAARQSGDFASVPETPRASRDQTTQKAMALLTITQKAVVTQYKAAHPRALPVGFGPPPGGGFGPPPGRGGFGPPPGGGPPPPMDGLPPGDE